MTLGQQINPQKRPSVVFIAILAMAIVQCFRLSTHWTIWWGLGESVITLFVIFLFGLTTRRQRDGANELSHSYPVMFTGITLLPILFQFVLRPLGVGDPNELILLNLVQNAAVTSAIVPISRQSIKISGVLSAFLVLFVTAMTENSLIWLMSGVFSAAGLWCLICGYWSRLETRFVTSSSQLLPIRPIVIGSTVMILIGAVAVASVSTLGTLTVLPGFMPTSGGNKYQSKLARSGVGEGDLIIAAQDSAFSFGPVDSEIFLESTMPSLYDVADDRYGEAAKKKNLNKELSRSISLTADRLKQTSDTPRRSDQASRQFSTLRRLTDPADVRLKNRTSSALLQVAGPTPLHLVTERFDTFDGIQWHHTMRGTPQLNTELENIDGKPWIKVNRAEHSILKGKQSHTLKVINLKSKRIPSPGHLAGIHISDVDRIDFFDQSEDGVFQLAAQPSIPRFTVIHLVSRMFSNEAILKLGDFRKLYYHSSNPFTEHDVLQNQSIEQVHNWVADVNPGWEQVCAVVDHLRTHFTCDPRAKVDEASEHVIDDFMKTRRGPDFMFATAAAMGLRSLGYQTQVVMGFYADSRDYQSRGNQAIVNASNLHFWTEVHVGHGVWIPIEPTPGYEKPQGWLSLQQRISMAIGSMLNWVMTNWLVLGLMLPLMVLGYRKRHLLTDLISKILWRAGWFGTTQRRIAWTIRILEWRARMAGHARPSSTTLRKWYSSLAAKDQQLQEHPVLETILNLANLAFYSPHAQDNETWTDHPDLYNTCSSLLSIWTSYRLKNGLTKAEPDGI